MESCYIIYDAYQYEGIGTIFGATESLEKAKELLFKALVPRGYTKGVFDCAENWAKVDENTEEFNGTYYIKKLPFLP